MAPLSWWPFLILVFLLGIFTRVYPLAAFAIMLLTISGLAHWWRDHALDGVSYQRRFIYRRGYPGEKMSVQVEVENRKFLPTPWLRVQDPLPAAVSPEDEMAFTSTHTPEVGLLTSLFSLRWYERDRRIYALLLRKRGIYRLGPPQLESGDIFGVFEQISEPEHYDYITVFPERLPPQALPLPIADPYGDQRTRRRFYDDPTQPMGVRDYSSEDDFRHIHWPATARTGELQVRVFQPVSARMMVVCLNVSTFPRYWEGTHPELLEYMVQVSATLVEKGLQDGYRVGLVSNGCLGHSDQPFRIPPGRSPAQLVQLLTALAGVTPFVTGAFDRFLITEAPHQPSGATFVIVTALMNQSLAETLLRLRRHNRHLVLLCFATEKPPVIPGIKTYHMPFWG